MPDYNIPDWSFSALFFSFSARRSFSIMSRHFWKFSTTTPTNMFSTTNPANKRNATKYKTFHLFLFGIGYERRKSFILNTNFIPSNNTLLIISSNIFGLVIISLRGKGQRNFLGGGGENLEKGIRKRNIKGRLYKIDCLINYQRRGT